MDNEISKARRFRHSRLKLSKCLQELLLSAITISSPAGTGVRQDAPAKSTKRPHEEVDQLPAKKARLSTVQQSETQFDRVHSAENV